MYNFTHSCEISRGRIHFKKAKKNLNLADIIMLQADVNYTIFFLKNGKRYVTAHSLKRYETVLEAYGFVRIHRAYLINRSHFKRYDSDNEMVLMNNNLTALISRRKKRNLIE